MIQKKKNIKPAPRQICNHFGPDAIFVFVSVFFVFSCFVLAAVKKPFTWDLAMMFPTLLDSVLFGT